MAKAKPYYLPLVKRKLLSAELAQMLDRPRMGPARPFVLYDEKGRSLIECDTRRQMALYLKANRILAKAGFFAPKEQTEVWDASMIGVHGLRPMWHGRAS